MAAAGQSYVVTAPSVLTYIADSVWCQMPFLPSDALQAGLV